jgi:predicted permease
MNFLFTFEQSVVPILLIILTGFIYYKICKPDIKQLANPFLLVFSPMTVFNELVKNSISPLAISKHLLFMIMLTSALMVLGLIIVRVFRIKHGHRMPFILTVSMINIGNFGVPLIIFTYGQAGLHHSIMTFIAFNLPLTTIAIYLSSGQATKMGAFMDMVKIPMFHATVLALIVTGFGIHIPEPVMKVTGFLGSATFPLAIFILGMQVASIRFSANILWLALLAVTVRLCVSPFMSWELAGLSGLSGLEKSVAVIQTSGPSAILPLIYAIKFNRPTDLLAATVLLTTAVSAITLTILITLIS